MNPDRRASAGKNESSNAQRVGLNTDARSAIRTNFPAANASASASPAR